MKYKDKVSSYRIILFFDENLKINEVIKISLNKVVKGNYIPKLPKNSNGHWVDICDKKDTVLFRILLHNPFMQAVEVIVDENERESKEVLKWVKQEKRKGIISIVIPNLENAAFLKMYSDRSSPIDEFRKATEIANFDLPNIEAVESFEFKSLKTTG